MDWNSHHRILVYFYKLNFIAGLVTVLRRGSLNN